MSSRKRSFNEYLDDKPKLQINLAAKDTQQEQHAEPLAPHRHIVQLFSLCAAGLPAQPGEDAVWNLSNILIDGQPVSRATVVAWLNAAYQIVYDADFEAQEAADNPVLTFEGLHRVLAFADAVDSAHGVMKHWMSKLGELRLHAALGKQQLVLRPNGIDYMWLRASEDSESELQLAGYPPGKLEPEGVGQPAASNEQKQAFKQQVAAQTEQLLWLAYRLQLQPLVHHLHGFIRSSCLSPISLLHGQEAAVITPRVLEAAVASGKHGVWQAVADSVRRQDVAFTDDAMLGDTAAFLAPLTLTQQQKQPLEFDAMLHADVMGIASGTKVRVYLDLFGESSIHLNQDIHTVRLRIGPFSFR